MLLWNTDQVSRQRVVGTLHYRGVHGLLFLWHLRMFTKVSDDFINISWNANKRQYKISKLTKNMIFRWNKVIWKLLDYFDAFVCVGHRFDLIE